MYSADFYCAQFECSQSDFMCHWFAGNEVLKVNTFSISFRAKIGHDTNAKNRKQVNYAMELIFHNRTFNINNIILFLVSRVSSCFLFTLKRHFRLHEVSKNLISFIFHYTGNSLYPTQICRKLFSLIFLGV